VPSQQICDHKQRVLHPNLPLYPSPGIRPIAFLYCGCAPLYYGRAPLYCGCVGRTNPPWTASICHCKLIRQQFDRGAASTQPCDYKIYHDVSFWLEHTSLSCSIAAESQFSIMYVHSEQSSSTTTTGVDHVTCVTVGCCPEFCYK
jgi:hypothetical protein